MRNQTKLENYIKVYPEEVALNTNNTFLLKQAKASLIEILNDCNLTINGNSPIEKSYKYYIKYLLPFDYEKINKLGWFLIYIGLKNKEHLLNVDFWTEIEEYLEGLRAKKYSRVESIMTIFALDLLMESFNNLSHKSFVLEKIRNTLKASSKNFYNNEYSYIKKLKLEDWKQLNNKAFSTLYKELYWYPLKLDDFEKRLKKEFFYNIDLLEKLGVESQLQQKIGIDELKELYKKTFRVLRKDFDLISKGFNIKIVPVPDGMKGIINKAYFLYYNKIDKSRKYGEFFLNDEMKIGIGDAFLLLFHEVYGHGVQFWYLQQAVKKNNKIENYFTYQNRFFYTEGWAILMEDYLLNFLDNNKIEIDGLDSKLVREEVKRKAVIYKIIRIMRSIYEINVYKYNKLPQDNKLYKLLPKSLQGQTLDDYFYFCNTPLYAMSYMQGYLFFKNKIKDINSKALKKIFINLDRKYSA